MTNDKDTEKESNAPFNHDQLMKALKCFKKYGANESDQDALAIVDDEIIKKVKDD